MAPLQKRPSFFEIGAPEPRIVAQPLPPSYLRVTNNRDFDDFMKLTYVHNQNEVAKSAEQLANLTDKMNFGVPGFQPPRPPLSQAQTT